MFKRVVSAGLLAVFLTTNVFSSPGNIARHGGLPLPVRLPSVRIQPSISIPQKTSGASFYLIEDVHSNLEAQKNIGQTLLLLEAEAAKEGKRMLVCAEAAHGPFDFSRFRRFPDPTVLPKIADTLLAQDLISAVSWFGLTGNTPVIGVDDPAAYLKNVESYRKSYLRKERLSRHIKGEIERLALRAEKIPSSQQRAVFTTVKEYYAGTLPMAEALRRLAKLNKESLPGSLKDFLNVVDLEARLDRSQIEREKEIFLSQQGDLTSLKKLPALASYLDYARAVESLKLDRLFSDIGRVIEGINQPLVNRLVDLNLQDKLVRFEMTETEWASYEHRRPMFAESLASFEDFYRLALSRNSSLAANALKAAKKENAGIVVLVAGGFHSAGIKTFLEKQGAAVTVLTPKLTSAPVNASSPALNSFLKDHGPLQKLFFTGRLSVADAGHMLGAPVMGNSGRLLPKALPVIAFLMAAFAAKGGVQAAEQAAVLSASNGAMSLVGAMGSNAVVHMTSGADLMVGPSLGLLKPIAEIGHVADLGNVFVAQGGGWNPLLVLPNLRFVGAIILLVVSMAAVIYYVIDKTQDKSEQLPDEIKFQNEREQKGRAMRVPEPARRFMMRTYFYAALSIATTPIHAALVRLTIWWFAQITRKRAIESIREFNPRGVEVYAAGAEVPIGPFKAEIYRKIIGGWSVWLNTEGSWHRTHLPEIEPFLKGAESVRIVNREKLIEIYPVDKKGVVASEPATVNEFGQTFVPSHRRKEDKPGAKSKNNGLMLGVMIAIPLSYIAAVQFPHLSIYLSFMVAGVFLETTQRFARRYNKGEYDRLEPDVLKQVEAGLSLNPSREADAYHIDIENYTENIRLFGLAVEELITHPDRITFTDLMGGIAGRMKKVAPGPATIALLRDYVEWLKTNGVDVFAWMRAHGKNIHTGDYEALALNYPTKGVIPVGKNQEGKYVTKLGEFLIGIRRLQEFLESEKIKRGLPAGNPIKLQVVLIATDEARDALIDWDLKIHNYYGLSPDQIKIRVQEINYGFVARPQDVEKYKANFIVGSDDSKYQAALEYAKAHHGAVVMSKTPWGHAEVPIQTISSGHIIELLERKAYANFVRNVDNSGAKPDWMWLVGYGRALEARRQGARIGLALEVSERPKDESGRGGGVFRLGENGHSRHIVLEDSILRMVRESIRRKTIPEIEKKGFHLVQDMADIALLIAEDEVITTTLGTRLTGQQVRQWVREYDNVSGLDKRIEIYLNSRTNELLVFEQLVDRSSYYVNNAVGTVFWDVILEDIFETSEKEVLSLRSLSEEERDSKLREISDRGWSKVNLIFEPKPHKLEDGTTIPIIRPEGNMWDLLKIVHVMALGVDSTESIGRKISANPFLSRMYVELMRFAPVKSWTDSDTYLTNMSGEDEEDEWSINEAMLQYTFSGDMFKVPTVQSFSDRSSAGSLHPLHKHRRVVNWEWTDSRVALKQGVVDEDLEANKIIIDDDLQPIPQRSLTLDVPLNERLKPRVDRDVIIPLKKEIEEAGLGDKIAWKETIDLSLANLVLNQGSRKISANEIRRALHAVNTIAKDMSFAPFVAEGVYLSESFTVRIAAGPRADDNNHSDYEELRDRLNDVLGESGGHAPKDFYLTIARVRKPMTADEFRKFSEILSRYKDTRLGQFSIREAVINEHADWTHTDSHMVRRYGNNTAFSAFFFLMADPSLTTILIAASLAAVYVGWKYYSKRRTAQKESAVRFYDLSLLKEQHPIDVLMPHPIGGQPENNLKHDVIRGALESIFAAGRVSIESINSAARLVGRNNALGLPVANANDPDAIIHEQANVLAAIAAEAGLADSIDAQGLSAVISNLTNKIPFRSEKETNDMPHGVDVFAHYRLDDFKLAERTGGLEQGIADLAKSLRDVREKRLAGVVLTIGNQTKINAIEWLRAHSALSTAELMVIEPDYGVVADPVRVHDALVNERGLAANWILARPLQAGYDQEGAWMFSDPGNNFQVIIDMISVHGDYVRIRLEETFEAARQALKAA